MPITGMSHIFLAVQYNFDNFHHLPQLLTLTMASMRLWHVWLWSRCISLVLLHGGHIRESLNPIIFRCYRDTGEVHGLSWPFSWIMVQPSTERQRGEFKKMFYKVKVDMLFHWLQTILILNHKNVYLIAALLSLFLHPL